VLSGAAGKTTSSSRMPVIQAVLNGRCFLCLVDTGSERTLVSPRVVVGKALRPSRPLLTADGKASNVRGSCRVVIGLQGHCFGVNAPVMNELCNLGVDCLLGGDVIDHMGGVTVQRDTNSRYLVQWGRPPSNVCCGTLHRGSGRKTLTCGAVSARCDKKEVLTVDDPDFHASFENGQWTVSWRWSGESPKKLQSRVSEYKCTQEPQLRERYRAEIENWISKGWLKPWNGPAAGIIPLLAVFQPTKDKVRPVMDYRELNNFVECHTGDDMVAVCGDKLRKWRQLQGEVTVVDLKSAYLQIHVAKDLWKYQVVRYEGVHYALTRLGFGLSCAPRIMTSILSKVLSIDETVRRGTDHYIDDIVVQESVVSADRVRKHLEMYGLVTKEPESLDGGRLLGVALRRGSGGCLEMSRGTALDAVSLDPATLTKRELFSLCGRLVGHYPIAGWLRPHCSYLKRLGCSGAWDEQVEPNVRSLAVDLLARARQEDPVKGRWKVNTGGPVTVWTDASSLAMGVVLEVDGSIVEDAAWLRKNADCMHINVAELEAVARGMNLAITWGFKVFTLAIDSLTVVNWMSNVIDKRSRVRTKGAAEMLVKRRLVVIGETIAEYGLDVSVRFVPSAENKADRLTRVPKRWLEHRELNGSPSEVAAVIVTGQNPKDAVWAAHKPHHLGVDRTLYLARQIRGDLSREQVKQELLGCEACQRIDPAMRSENMVARGNLAVDDNWSRVAVDVTHYGSQVFLSMVDCGPSRFAIWRRLQNESATQIVTQLKNVAIERGPWKELLMDNSTAFRSAVVEQFADEWGISLRFRAAYAPSGNGIVERNHRTIKRIAERGQISPEEATFWYNATPRKETEDSSVPSRSLFRYRWRVPFDVNQQSSGEEAGCSFSVGDEVWVKPNPPSCTSQWALGRVTSVVSEHTVCVNGMPRHVRDIRKRRQGSDMGSLTDSYAEGTDGWVESDGSQFNDRVPQEALQDVVDAGGVFAGPTDELVSAPAGGRANGGVERQQEGVVGPPAREASEPPGLEGRPQRERRRPQYLDEYVC